MSDGESGGPDKPGHDFPDDGPGERRSATRTSCTSTTTRPSATARRPATRCRSTSTTTSPRPSACPASSPTVSARWRCAARRSCSAPAAATRPGSSGSPCASPPTCSPATTSRSSSTTPATDDGRHGLRLRGDVEGRRRHQERLGRGRGLGPVGIDGRRCGCSPRPGRRRVPGATRCRARPSVRCSTRAVAPLRRPLRRRARDVPRVAQRRRGRARRRRGRRRRGRRAPAGVGRVRRVTATSGAKRRGAPVSAEVEPKKSRRTSSRPRRPERRRRRRLAVVYDIEGPRVRLGVGWFVLVVAALALGALDRRHRLRRAPPPLAAARRPARWRRRGEPARSRRRRGVRRRPRARGRRRRPRCSASSCSRSSSSASSWCRRRSSVPGSSPVRARSSAAIWVGRCGGRCRDGVPVRAVGGRRPRARALSAYETGDYLVGSGARNAFEGPIAGIAAVLVVQFGVAAVGLPPFELAERARLRRPRRRALPGRPDRRLARAAERGGAGVGAAPARLAAPARPAAGRWPPASRSPRQP